MRRKHCEVVLAIVLLLACTATSAFAASVTGNGVVTSGSPTGVTFDHLNDPSYVEYKLKLHDGEMFSITILNTLPNRFDYEVEAIARPTPQVAATSEVRQTELVTYQMTRVHDRKYAGYAVHIKPKDGIAVDILRNDQSRGSLGTAELSISVETLEWDSEMAGAFTATGLRDPVFALQKRTENGTEQQFIIRDRKAEDSTDLGMAAFIHVFHTSVPWIAGTFGLGINDGNRTTYFVGPTIRFGNKAALTAGVAAGSLSRLPSGLSIGDKVTDSNALANLGTKIGRSWFVGISYTFLNPGNALKKPFAGEGNVTPAAPAATGKTSTSSTTTVPVTTPTAPATGNPAAPATPQTNQDPFPKKPQAQ